MGELPTLLNMRKSIRQLYVYSFFEFQCVAKTIELHIDKAQDGSNFAPSYALKN